MNRKRILFVDDEPNLLDGLRRMLRKFRSEWDVSFASGGRDALTRLAQSPVDVLVTDLQMPEMNGAELLERVHTNYPGIVRIVLCGTADEQSTNRALRAAHQFLSKPIDADALTKAIARACTGGQVLGDERMRVLVGSCDTLPSLPSLYVEITQAVISETAGAKTISDVISRDVSMSAKLLQLVNSSFFGIGRRVSSVEQTVALLGVIRIKALVLQQNLMQQFVPPRELVHFSMPAFWRHSLLVGEIGRLITWAEKQDGDRPDQAFTAGLLHDIGKLVLAARSTRDYEAVLESAHKSGEPLHLVEARILGVTHSDVGAYLLRLWGLPERIVEAVAFHHRPSGLGYDGFCALTAVHAADTLLAETEQAQTGSADLPPGLLDLPYLERTGKAVRLEAWRALAEDARKKCSAAEQ